MLVITIYFLNGAYHATPWGKHANEGVPEWPPSPWRLLRAIIATWKNTRPELKDEKVWPILQKLTRDPPDYNLPDASVSHTRHFMPTNEKPSLVINTFVVTGNRPIDIIWNDVTLNPEEVGLLGKILKNLHYFGRAESWCTVYASNKSRGHNCSPLENRELSTEEDLVQVLVPNSDVGFVDLCNPKSSDDILKSISITVSALQDKKYIDPPGGRWMQYVIPQNCFEEKSSSNARTYVLSNIGLVRYAVVGTIRPSIKDTLRVGDLARSACMSKYGKKKNGENSATFSGKEGEGKPLTNHKHAFYLPTYETQCKEIDHLTIIAPGGFDEDELAVLFTLNRCYGYNVTDVHLLFQGCGTVNNFSDIPILKKSRKWISATPLILSRHIKYRGKKNDKRMVDGPEEQIRNEVMKRYGKEYELKDVKVDESQTNMNNTAIKPSDFFRWRKHGSVGSSNTYKIQLEFKGKVNGPITLGYASHFGLGMFVPLENE